MIVVTDRASCQALLLDLWKSTPTYIGQERVRVCLDALCRAAEVVGWDAIEARMRQESKGKGNSAPIDRLVAGAEELVRSERDRKNGSLRRHGPDKQEVEQQPPPWRRDGMCLPDWLTAKGEDGFQTLEDHWDKGLVDVVRQLHAKGLLKRSDVANANQVGIYRKEQMKQ